MRARTAIIDASKGWDMCDMCLSKTHVSMCEIVSLATNSTERGYVLCRDCQGRLTRFVENYARWAAEVIEQTYHKPLIGARQRA